MEEVELNHWLSLGCWFGLNRKGDKLPRSSSIAAMLTTPVEVLARPDLPRTSSLPGQVKASKVGRKHGLAGWSSWNSEVLASTVEARREGAVPRTDLHT
jgi:hypothetical protein